MTKQDQQELKADVSWFHIFKEIIRNGTWARMSLSAKAVYPAIKSYVNWENGSAFPSLDTLEEFSGVSRPSVVSALKELVALGLLKKKTEKGRNSVYSLVEKFDVKDGDGNQKAVVSFDYIPTTTAKAIEEFRRILSDGIVSPDGKTNFVKIDTLNLNIHTGSGDNYINNVFAGIDAATVLKGISDMAQKRDTEEAKLVADLAIRYNKDSIPPRD